MDTELKQFEERQLALISPLEATSRQLAAVAGNIVVTDAATLTEANQLKKDMNAHNKIVKELRLDLTRPLDDITKQLIAREREILTPLDEGKTLLAGKILAYEEEQERLRAAEQQRVADIVAGIQSHYKPGMTEGQVATAKAAGKKIIAELAPGDADNAEIKLALMTLSNKLTERGNDLEVEKQRAQKQKLMDDETRIANERRELEAAKERKRIEEQQLEAYKAAARAEAARPKSNIATYTEFEITNADAVAREFCSPDNVKIRAYLKQYPDAQPAGIRVFKTKKVR